MAGEECLLLGGFQDEVAQQDEKRTPNPINAPKRRIENIPEEANQKIGIERRQIWTQRVENQKASDG
jgi:hypothetical protein